MLMLTTGFMMCAAALWLAVYWSMGYQYSTAIPLIFQALSFLTITLYWKFRRVYAFAVIQPALRHGLELAAGDTSTRHRQT